MPITMPQVTGWPQNQLSAVNPADVYDPLAGDKRAMEAALFADKMANASQLRRINQLKIDEEQNRLNLAKEMEGANKAFLGGQTSPMGTGRPPEQNAFSPYAQSTTAQPTQTFEIPGGTVSREDAMKYPNVFVPKIQEMAEQKRKLEIERQKKQEEGFEANISKAIDTSDPANVVNILEFYKTSRNPYIKERAAEMAGSFKNLGGGNFKEERFFSADELQKARENARTPEEKQNVPFAEGFFTHAREKGKITWKQEKISDDELADAMAYKGDDPRGLARKKWAEGLFSERGKIKLAGKDYTTVGVTASGGTISAKNGINYYWHPSMGNQAPVPWDQATHGKILPKTESYIERIQKGEEFIGTPQEIAGDVNSIRKGLIDPTKVATGGGMGGYGLAYARATRQAVRAAQEREGLPDFNYALANQNFKYMDNPNTLRAIGLSRAVLPRVFAMEDKIDKIGNKFGAPILDLAWNKVRKEVLGDVGLADYESLRNDIIQEVNSALSGTSVSSDSRLNLELERLKSSATPGQLRTAIKNLKSALQARIDSGAMIPNPWEVVRGEISQKEWFNAMAEGRDPKDIRGNTTHVFGMPQGEKPALGSPAKANRPPLSSFEGK